MTQADNVNTTTHLPRVEPYRFRCRFCRHGALPWIGNRLRRLSLSATRRPDLAFQPILSLGIQIVSPR
jgi:hypothetical protein